MQKSIQPLFDASLRRIMCKFDVRTRISYKLKNFLVSISKSNRKTNTLLLLTAMSRWKEEDIGTILIYERRRDWRITKTSLGIHIHANFESWTIRRRWEPKLGNITLTLLRITSVKAKGVGSQLLQLSSGKAWFPKASIMAYLWTSGNQVAKKLYFTGLGIKARLGEDTFGIVPRPILQLKKSWN